MSENLNSLSIKAAKVWIKLYKYHKAQKMFKLIISIKHAEAHFHLFIFSSSKYWKNESCQINIFENDFEQLLPDRNL